MTARQRLPHRRRNETIEATWQGRQLAVCIGYDDCGQPAEVFARLAKPGSELDLLLDDAGVMLSLLMQNGVPAKQLAHSVGRAHDEPASVIGVLVDILAGEAGL